MAQQLRIDGYFGFAAQPFLVDPQRPQKHVDMRKIFHIRPNAPAHARTQ
jgi:hypothetical protein